MPLGDSRPVAVATSVVLRGHFRPSLFGPAWFHSLALVSDGDYLEHDLRSITRDTADFTLGTLDVFITESILQLGTRNSEQFNRLRDLAVGTLRELRHTPVSALGINRAFHTGTADIEGMHRIGDTLAPKQPWQGLLDSPGVRAIETWGVRDDGWKGRVGIVVEPSDRIQPGVYINVNDHYELEPERQKVNRDRAFLGQDTPSEATEDKRSQAREILTSGWDDSAARAESLHNRIMQLAG